MLCLMNSIAKGGTVLLLSAFLLAFFIAPARCCELFFDGVALWATAVLPAVFPFLFATAMLTNLGASRKLSALCAPIAKKAFRVSALGGSLFALSVLSGYPVGSRLLADSVARGDISQTEAQKLAPLLSSCGPLFLLGSVGAGLFRSRAIGAVLLLSNFLAVSASGVLLRFRKGGQSDAPPPLSASSLSETLLSSVLTVLTVGAYIALFSAAAGILIELPVLSRLPETAKGAIAGLVEMTTGCRLLASPCRLNVALCAFFVTFGGACVLLQQLTFLSPPVRVLPFLGAKLLQGVLAFLFAFLICPYHL